MASNYVEVEEEGKFERQYLQASPREHAAAAAGREFRRSWSSVSSSTSGCGHSAPKCVCAPATHAGSFKCRLHRAGGAAASSHAYRPHSSQPSSPSAPAPPPPPAASSASSRTVEAQ